MSNPYKISSDDKFTGVTVIIDGEPYTVANAHANYDRIVGHLLDGVDDDDKLMGLISPIQEVQNKLTPLTERLTYRGGKIYLDGDILDNSLTELLVRLIESGSAEADYLAYANFIEKLVTNPSKQSRKHLYKFIEANQITLLPNGNLLLYKGVKHDGTSLHMGYGIIDGIVHEHDYLLNVTGSVVEMPRSMVDDDRDQTCSIGLHVGAYKYASGFGSRLITVSVNPRDVVSVPSDYNDQKMRVSRYTVLEGVEQVEEVATPVFVPADTNYPSADDSETELSDKEIKDNNKISGFLKVLESLDESEYRRYRNKRVTQKNRALFDAAIDRYQAGYRG